MSRRIKDIVILADGSFPTAPYPLQILAEADYLICCDGAVESYLTNIKHPGRPDAIVGDMDSLPVDLQKQFADIIHWSPDQEVNDLTKAVEYILMKDMTESIFCKDSRCTILGATGKREDHTLGNISLLQQYSEQLSPITVRMVTDYGEFFTLTDSSKIQCTPGCPISLFAFDNTLRIKARGLKYPTENVTFTYWWEATLNTAESSEIHLEFNHPAKVLIYTVYSKQTN